MRIINIVGIVLAGSVLLLVIAAGLFQMSKSRTFQVAGELVHRVEADKKIVALTFDDGPTERTDEILAALDADGIKGTFYLVGSSIEENPEATKRIINAGHEVGNHSYSHERFLLKSTSFVTKEIESTDALIRAAGYEGEITFRPPFGKKLFSLPLYLAKHDRTSITWDVEPDSYPEVAKTGEAIAQFVEEHVQPGSIILLHPMYNQPDVDAIPLIVASLRAQGYEFVTISELLDNK